MPIRQASFGGCWAHITTSGWYAPAAYHTQVVGAWYGRGVASSSSSADERLANSAAIAGRIVEQVGSVLRGKQEAVRLAVAALLAQGHVLIEDVPGVGKTTLARALAASIGLSFRRVQFTSDLMPVDVVGGNVFDRATSEFRFRPGPVFSQVLLADEINRTTPKTQSALLEAMGERQVSIDGQTHPLPEPFFVIATQNPQDFYGTYPLPESQLDRFLMRLHLGYPDRETERAVIAARRNADPVAKLQSVVNAEELRAAMQSVDDIQVEGLVVDYLHEIVLATRESSLLSLGASTRAAIAYERAVRARAVVEARSFATTDDVKQLAVAILSHRVRAPEGTSGDTAHVLAELLEQIAVPI